MKVYVYCVSVCLYIIVSFTDIAHAEKGDIVTAPNVIPPATGAMQNAEFWISRINSDPDSVIMSPEQIAELNRENRSRPMETTDINGDPYSIRSIVDRKDIIGIQFHLEDPLVMMTFPGDSLRVRFRRAREYVENGKWYDRRYLKVTDEMKLQLIEATDESYIPDTVYPRYGILVRHTLNRIMPTHEAFFWRQFSWQDALQSSSLETGMPVAILHTSKEDDWYYVKSELSFGWVPAINVAEGSVKKIRHLAESGKFIVALEHKVPVYVDSEYKTFFTEFFQGARLRLENETSRGYRVLVPFRKANGSLDACTGWVKPDAGINVGFQPFTQRNVIETVFRLLYRPYGWADSHHERDCCGTIRTVLKTFGIFTPRWTTYELHNANHMAVFPRGTAREVKYKYLDTCEPGITICGFSGHVVMYLGKVDGVYYVIHQSGYSYHDDEGTELRVGRVIVNDTELEGGSHIDRFTEISTFKP